MRAEGLRAAVRGSLLALGLVATSLAGLDAVAVAPRAEADLRGPHDVTRALAALGSEDPERRARAAEWLALHGPDELVAPPLVEALEREQGPATLVPIALAVARRARVEEAPRLLELEARLRSPARAVVMVTLAQLATPETDAWLLGRLAEGTSAELRPALEQLAEVARARREQLLPPALEALTTSRSPLLLAWVASLADERARGVLLALSSGEDPPSLRALEGLAALGPDATTAARLLERLRALLQARPPPARPPMQLLRAAGAETTLAELEPPVTSVVLTEARAPALLVSLARAFVAADPEAEEVTLLLETGDAAVRAATLDALVVLAPERAVAILGEDPRALSADDARVLERAIEHPAPALVPWLRGLARDETRDDAARERALEALVRARPCGDTTLAALSLPSARLAQARLARACGSSAGLDGDDPSSLWLRAVAGEDVRSAVRARFATAEADARLELAHAWLASRERDDAIAAALAREEDRDVFEVLAAAATRQGLEAEPRALLERLETPRSRAAALTLLGRASASLPPPLLRHVRRALRDSDPRVLASALLAARARPDILVAPYACAALEHADPRVRRAAWFASERDAPCLGRRARIDPELRAFLASPPSTPGEEPIVLRVVSNVGASLPRVSLAADDGRWLVLRPTASGGLVVPGLGAAEVTVVLDPSDP